MARYCAKGVKGGSFGVLALALVLCFVTQHHVEGGRDLRWDTSAASAWDQQTNQNEIQLPKLIGTDVRCRDPITGLDDVCIGLDYLPSFEDSDLGLVSYGINYTGVVQMAGLSAYDKERHVLVLYGAAEKTKQTRVLSLDARTSEVVNADVPVPVTSFGFIGIGIRLGRDSVGKRTVVVGPNTSPQESVLSHGFYEVLDDSREARSLGYNLEDAVPRGFFELGYLEVMGTQLGVYEEERGVFWLGLARNSTATKSVEFLLVGIDVDHGTTANALTFPFGDCEVLGPMVWQEETKRILMPTFKTGTRDIIIGSIDPMEGTCTQVTALPLALLPYAGFMTFPPNQTEPTVTLLVNADADEEDELLLASSLHHPDDGDVLSLPQGVVAGSLQHPSFLASLRPMSAEGEDLGVWRGEPSKATKAQKFVNFDLATGEVTSESQVICSSGSQVDPCPGQLHWAI